MKELARLAAGAVALALAAAGTSCGQQSPQEPQDQAQNKAPQPKPQQAQNQAPSPQNPAPQPEPQQAQNQAQPPQNQAPQPEPQPSQAQQAQPIQQSANKQTNPNGSQNTAEDSSQGETLQIQQALEQKGFKVGPLDGKFGTKTKRALSQFQRKHGLQQTGMPDERTLAALGIGGGAGIIGRGPFGSSSTPPAAQKSN